MFGTMSEEQRQKAQLARKEKREKGLSMFKTDWADDAHWQELAKEANIKLPQHHVAPSGIKLSRVAKQLGLEWDWVQQLFGTGIKNAVQGIKTENERRVLGEKYNMRCYVGHLLELWNTRKGG